jgi:hypothetical protein
MHIRNAAREHKRELEDLQQSIDTIRADNEQRAEWLGFNHRFQQRAEAFTVARGRPRVNGNHSDPDDSGDEALPANTTGE